MGCVVRRLTSRRRRRKAERGPCVCETVRRVCPPNQARGARPRRRASSAPADARPRGRAAR
eukprot:7144754-Prymnesium_polylepis.3